MTTYVNINAVTVRSIKVYINMLIIIYVRPRKAIPVGLYLD